MSKKMLLLSVSISILLVCSLSAEQISSTWVGGWGDWDITSNWSPAIVPNNGGSQTFAVTIDGSVEYVGVGFYQDFTIDSLTTYGDVELQKWVLEPIWGLTVLNGLTNYGDDVEIRIPIDGNIINNDGNLQICADVYGDVTNNSGATLDFSEHANIYGDLINNANATIEFQNIDTDVEGDGDGGKIINNGLIKCFPGGGVGEDALFENNGAIELYSIGVNGEVFDNNAAGTIKGWGGATGGQLRNKGLIEASMGQLVLGFGSITNTGLMKVNSGADMFVSFSTSDVNNRGQIEINAGGSVVCDTNLVNQPDSVTILKGGTLAATTITQKADANFTGFGGVTGNVQIEPDAIVKLTGPTNIVGDVNIAAGATLQISDGQTLITGHTTCKGTIHLKGGTVIFQGGCDCEDCNIINEAGVDRNHFDLNADGKVDLEDFDYFAESWLWQASWY